MVYYMQFGNCDKNKGGWKQNSIVWNEEQEPKLSQTKPPDFPRKQKKKIWLVSTLTPYSSGKDGEEGNALNSLLLRS